ncbi:unnamed protein product [Didymodactylos carnosus]|uniref:Uncharacterized protein n=1 Tax=Didymodactylos carnosus TaxID=1234261 RepID=A0A815AF82_9BILA|nr:unnamed protein product [Didymodactylos carnosus]CAF4030763.1 unnamed protein product [Didymodactylos carnosus]
MSGYTSDAVNNIKEQVDGFTKSFQQTLTRSLKLLQEKAENEMENINGAKYIKADKLNEIVGSIEKKNIKGNLTNLFQKKLQRFVPNLLAITNGGNIFNDATSAVNSPFKNAQSTTQKIQPDVSGKTDGSVSSNFQHTIADKSLSLQQKVKDAKDDIAYGATNCSSGEVNGISHEINVLRQRRHRIIQDASLVVAITSSNETLTDENNENNIDIFNYDVQLSDIDNLHSNLEEDDYNIPTEVCSESDDDDDTNNILDNLDENGNTIGIDYDEQLRVDVSYSSNALDFPIISRSSYNAVPISPVKCKVGCELYGMSHSTDGSTELCYVNVHERLYKIAKRNVPLILEYPKLPHILLSNDILNVMFMGK